MTGTRTVYEEVIEVTQAYFGPAARRFVNRQISMHLGTEPDHLRTQDLSPLIDWMGAAMALLTDDRAAVNRYMSELRSLTKD